MIHSFRYTPRDKFLKSCMIYSLIMFVLLSGVFLAILYFSGILNGESGGRFSWLGQGALGFGITLGGLFLIFTLSMFAPRKKYTKMYDIEGKIIFHSSYAIMEYDGKTSLRIDYPDIRQIHVRYKAPGRTVEKKAAKCDYKIITSLGTYALSSSMSEMKELKPGEECSLKRIMDDLIHRSGAKVVGSTEGIPQGGIQKNESEDFFSGGIGDRMETKLFNFSVAKVWSKADNNFAPGVPHDILIVVDIIIENNLADNIMFDPSVFTLSWDSDIPTEGFCTAKNSGFTPLASKEERTISLFYEFTAAGQTQFILSYIEDEPESRLFAVDFEVFPEQA